MEKNQANDALSWLLNAQDVGEDDGFASHFEVDCGWHASYPEVTGYIIPTLFKYSKLTGRKELRKRALRAANWLLSIQNKTGSFQGRLIDEPTPTPVVFNTGMIIFGLLSAYDETKIEKYLEAAKSAGDWLVKIQEDTGEWKTFNTINGDAKHNYHTRVSWALLELFSRTNEESYMLSANANLENCLRDQQHDGWIINSSLTGSMQKTPLLHFLAYTIRGLLESGLLLNSEKLVNGAVRSASKLLDRFQANKEMFGRYDKNWEKCSEWQCLTGNFQTAIIFSKISDFDSSRDWKSASEEILDGSYKLAKSLCSGSNSNGAIAGSFPLDGEYMPGCFLSWATKFFLDAFYEIEVKNEV
jgi:hypothetical protein